MSAERVQARAGSYADSVTLMQVSAEARKAGGVEAAIIAMATDLNLSMAVAMGFQPPPASQNDLLIAIRARDEAALMAVVTAVDAALTRQPIAASGSVSGPAEPALTTGSAIRASGRGLVLVSVPGRYAFAEAMDALDAGCDVMIFSDNMPVEQEVLLKDVAGQRGLLVLGPDCGTAIVGGVGLGFSHTVDPGPVGLVAASGTGAQQVVCLLAHAGVGVSAALGVGGRDLSAEVGGRSARAALAAFDEDPATELILVISKPPAPLVAERARQLAAIMATPVQFALVGRGEPDLTAATEGALRSLGRVVPDWPRWPGHDDGPRRGSLRGLFVGGTLCDEAMVIASRRLGPVQSNIPLDPAWYLDPHAAATNHAMTDFGDDQLTVGRAHPMIDQSLRLERLAAEARNPATAVILLDVVLGHGAHPDPAGELGPAIAAALERSGQVVVVSLIGTASDPQDLHRQARALQAAGAHVFASNAQAARFACDQIAGAP